MKFLFDLFPVILFFAAFKLFGIYVATAAAIVATLLQIGWVKFRHGKVDNMLIASGIIIVVFGGATGCSASVSLWPAWSSRRT
jgi:intracellular septation protein